MTVVSRSARIRAAKRVRPNSPSLREVCLLRVGPEQEVSAGDGVRLAGRSYYVERAHDLGAEGAYLHLAVVPPGA